jgi:hypothetical protein
MVIKTQEWESLISDPTETFDGLRKFSMKLNPEKCTYSVSSRTLLRYRASQHGIDPNPEKVLAIMNMKPPKSDHEIHKLIGCMAALSRLILRLGVRWLPFFKLLKKVPMEQISARGIRITKMVPDLPTHSHGP